MEKQIAQYRIVRLIGAGGMGEVYEAVHEQIERRAAIKVLRKSFIANQEVVTRFLNEARAVNIVSHPSLVSIYECGQTSDGSPYIVMEYLEGETLRQRMSRVGRMPPQQAMSITRQMAAGLAAAHAKQIIHRDLKPVNVMIVSDSDMPDGERVKVLDFGIAKLVEEVGAEELTRTGALMGTPRYMSPEQCKSARNVTDRSDVYTLGLILYELLSGHSPWSDIKSDVLVMNAQVHQPPPRLADQAPDINPELLNLVDKMLDKEVENRPRATEVALALKQLTGGMPSTAFPIIKPSFVPGAVGSNHPVAMVENAEPPGGALPVPGRRFPQLGKSERTIVLAAVATLLLGLAGALLVVRSLQSAPESAKGPADTHLSILSDPAGAEVVDDSGAVLGHTPLARSQPASSGTVSFTLRHRGFAERRVTLSLSRDTDSMIALAPLPAAILPTASLEKVTKQDHGSKDKGSTARHRHKKK